MLFFSNGEFVNCVSVPRNNGKGHDAIVDLWHEMAVASVIGRNIKLGRMEIDKSLSYAEHMTSIIISGTIHFTMLCVKYCCLYRPMKYFFLETYALRQVDTCSYRNMSTSKSSLCCNFNCRPINRVIGAHNSNTHEIFLNEHVKQEWRETRGKCWGHS